MSKPPSITVAQSTPLTPKPASKHDHPEDTAPQSQNHLHTHTRNSSLSNFFKTNLTPSYSFGLGFSPSFQLYSPKNGNLFNSLSPQRFFQVSNNLNKVTKTTDKNVFNSSTPSKVPNNNKFLNSLSSVKNDEEAIQGANIETTDKDSATPGSVHHEESLWSSVNENDTNNMTALTVPIEGTPRRTPDKSDKANQNDFLTPRRLFLNKSDNDSMASKKRRLSIDESPNSSIASRLESMASPPRSLKSIPRRKSSNSLSSKSNDDKVWTEDLDDALLSSYLKFKEFKKHSIASESSVLRNASQNKVLSRMLLNKSGVLRTPKQISSRLFRITKHLVDTKKNSSQSSISLSQVGQRPAKYRILDESPSLTDEIDEIIRTPLEDLIGSTASHLDSISSAEINAQIDKELDLIFSPVELQASPFPADSFTFANITEFQISYNANENESIHYFIKNSSKSSRPFNLSSHSVSKKLQLQDNNDNTIKDFAPKIIGAFESNNLLVYEVSSSLDLDMVSKNNFDSLDSVIMNSNPFDLEKGFVNSFMKISINHLGSNAASPNWKCYTRIFNDGKLLLSSNDSIMCYSNAEGNGVDLMVPFLKNFWTGFLSLLINGNNDKNYLRSMSITQIIYEGSTESNTVRLCLIHRFDKFSRVGTSTFQLLKHTNEREDLNELNEEDENIATQEDHRNTFTSNDQTQNEEDDNETVLADSSPVRSLDSPPRNFKIDLSLAKANIIPGPASAPVFNPRLINQMTTRDPGMFSANQSFSTAEVPTFNHQNLQSNTDMKHFGYSMATPDVVSPFNSQVDGNGPRSLSYSGTPMTSTMVTSTPAKDTQLQQIPQGMHAQMPQQQQQRAQQLAMNGQVWNNGQTSQPQSQAQQKFNAGQQFQGSFNANGAPMSVPAPPQAQQPLASVLPSVPKMQPAQQQLMVNLGTGFVPFNTLPAELQEKYMPFQQQFHFQQQQLMLLQQQQQQVQPPQPPVQNQQQLQQPMVQPQQTQPTQQVQESNQFQQPLQNIPLNRMNTAPAQLSEGKFKKKKSPSNTIKFGPMLEYDPSKDSATAAAAAAAAASATAKANARKIKRPGVSVLNITRDSPVYIYKPPKRKSSTNGTDVNDPSSNE